jgi:hypothetical protein
MAGINYRYRRPRDDDLPTPRTALRTGYVRVLVFCNSCRHQADPPTCRRSSMQGAATCG